MVLARFDRVPAGATCLLVEGDDVGGLSGAAMSDQQVLVEHRRGGRAKHVGQPFELSVPGDFAIEVAGDDSCGAETGVYQASVRGG